MIIGLIRGLPGSGKSTYVQNLQKNMGEKEVINCCADDFFVADGEYKFDRTKIGEAHKQCFAKFGDAVLENTVYQNGPSFVCVSNVMSKLWEITPYISFANYYNLEYKVIHLKCSVETSIKRNIHNVSKDTIERMAKYWEHLPKSFGTETIIETD